MKHLRLFKYIDAVVRSGSIRRASEQLYITPSALDRRVQDLEEELQVKLFDRTPKGMRLTSAGELVLFYVRRHLADMQTLQSQIQNLNGLRNGIVTIAISPALASNFAPRIIKRFHECFPGISISAQVVKHEDAIKSLLNYDCDIAMIVAPPLHPDILYQAVAERPLTAIMDRNHPLANVENLRISDCMQYPLILPSSGLTSRTILDKVLHRKKDAAFIVAESNSYEIIRGLTILTNNIGFIISTGVEIENNAIAFQKICDTDMIKLPIVCAQLKNRGISVAAAQFSNFVAEELNNITNI